MAAGCGDDGRPPGVPADAMVQRDGGVLADGALADGALPDGPRQDGSVPLFDGEIPEGGDLPDRAQIGWDAEVPDLCTMGLTPDGGGCTDPMQCGIGATCVPGGCGDAGYCTPTGEPCMTAEAHCPATAACDVADGGDGWGACVGPVPGECLDWRTCPIGFACEEGSGGRLHCVDRRLPCPGYGGCPTGFSCFAYGASAYPFCFGTYRYACEAPSDCPPFMQCADILGNGDKRCFPEGSCDQLMDCSVVRPGTTCDVDITTERAACGPNGPCNGDGDCLPQAQCIDVDGDGLRTCQFRAGDCLYDRDCPAGALCFDRDGDFRNECAM